jgi:large subunit ribosomal protein L6
MLCLVADHDPTNYFPGEKEMSRIGKMPIPIPDATKVIYKEHGITVRGKKGELSRSIHPDIDLKIEDDKIMVIPANPSNATRALHGLTRTLVANMITGVVRGFERVLEISGVGYRVDIKKEDVLTLNIGYSHPVVYKLPEGIHATVEKQTKLILSGIDKELLGLTAGKIRGLRKAEPYKGKGIRYAGEYIRRKSGKSGAK